MFEILANAVHAADDAASGEVRTPHVFHQLVQCDVGVIDLCANSIDHLAEIMRRDICSHPNCNSGAAVHEQIWKSGGEDRWLSASLVVIRDKIEGVLLHVGVIDLGANSIDHLAEIMRRDICRHPNCNSGAAVHEQIWKSGGEDRWDGYKY